MRRSRTRPPPLARPPLQRAKGGRRVLLLKEKASSSFDASFSFHALKENVSFFGASFIDLKEKDASKTEDEFSSDAAS